MNRKPLPYIGKYSRPAPFARLRHDRAIDRLQHKPPTDWPIYLRQAHKLLTEIKTGDDAARSITTACFALALRCAQAINQRAVDRAHLERRQNLRRRFVRLAKAIDALPIGSRRALDTSVSELTFEPLETMEGLLEQMFAGLAESFSREACYDLLRSVHRRRAALKELSDHELLELLAEANTLMQVDFASLHPLDALRIERVVETSQDGKGAASICRGIAKALAQDLKLTKKLCVAELTTAFAWGAADIWRRQGLAPGRSPR